MPTAAPIRSENINTERHPGPTNTTTPPGAPDASPAAGLLDDVIERTAAKLDVIAETYSTAIFAPTVGRMRRAFIMEKGITQLRAMLDDKIMNRFQALAGSPLGFRTDKDDEGGYPAETLRECLIDALLRGLYPVGNEFNVIAGRMYVTKEGYARLVRETPGLTNLEITVGTPKSDQGQTLVRFHARWMLNGVRQELQDQDGKPGKVFVIRVNQGMIADAIVGKATRKGLKAIYDQINGSEFSANDGEVDEAPALAKESPAATVAEKLTRPTNGTNGNATATTQAEKITPPAEAPSNSAAETTREPSILERKLRDAIGLQKTSKDMADLRKLIGSHRATLGDTLTDQLIEECWNAREQLIEAKPADATQTQEAAPAGDQATTGGPAAKRRKGPTVPREPGVEDEE